VTERSETEAEPRKCFGTMPGMLFAAEVWHYWLGWAIAIGAVLTFVALLIGYLVKVQAPQYPKRGQR
jgi:protein-S-isoprenylcysteine O-methyltransferase Ste14